MVQWWIGSLSYSTGHVKQQIEESECHLRDGLVRVNSSPETDSLWSFDGMEKKQHPVSSVMKSILPMRLAGYTDASEHPSQSR